jgi:hypothetical protein
MIDVAIDEMKEAKIADITTERVWTYMTEQATNFQEAFLPLNAIIFWEIALLARHSERKNDVDLFLSVLRLSLPLYCNTNATEYTRLACDWLVLWDTASDLDRCLIRKYGFTVETVNGVRVGLDYSHEKFVNMI